MNESIRKKLIVDLIKEVYGPRNLFKYDESVEDMVNEKIFENPLNEYITGVLIPSNFTLDNNDEKTSENDFVNEESGFNDNSDDEDTEAVNVDVSTPSVIDPRLRTKSFGISFYIESTNPIIEICCTWGRYNTIHNEEGKINYFNRTPFSFKRKINIDDIDKSCSININSNYSEDEKIELYIKSDYHENNIYFISIYFVNRILLSDPRRLEIEKCIFQPSIRVIVNNETVIPNFSLNNHSNDKLEFLYRNRPICAKGHMCSAIWKRIDYIDEFSSNVLWPDGKFLLEKNDYDKFKKPDIRSEFVPIYPMPTSYFEKNDEKFLFNANLLSELWDNEDIDRYLQPLISEYSLWIQKNEKNIDEKNIKLSEEIIEDEKEALKRIKLGLDAIKTYENVKLAFCFANKAIHLQSKWIRGNNKEFQWRPFQLAFFLMNIESLINEKSEYRDTLDLLWISTGGGKTEAYLGIMAFIMAYRRIIEVNNNKSGAGTSILSRYTLRLLTVQQFRRTLTLVMAAEYLRTCNENGLWGWRPKNSSITKDMIYGSTRFSIGLWVGSNVSPNKLFSTENCAISILSDPKDNFDNSGMSNPAQVIRCPVCGNYLSITSDGIPKEKKPLTLHVILKEDYEDIISYKEVIENKFKSFIKEVKFDMENINSEFLTISFKFIHESISYQNILELSEYINKVFNVASLNFLNPGYFGSIKSVQNSFFIDYEIFCTDPECPLNNHQWFEGTPAENTQKYIDGNYAYTIPNIPFSNSNRMPISAYVVDEQIYTKCPTVIISTVDKIARLAYEPKAASLFGNVDYYNPFYGYHREIIGDAYTEYSQKYLNKSVKLENHLKPINLIIQDELHLIDGPLGSLFGLYETAVDAIISSNNCGNPKYIASTATIKNTESQTKKAFSKDLFQFPPYGLVIDDNFFVKEIFDKKIWDENNPGRIYMGIYSPGRGPLTPQIRLWSRIFDTSKKCENLKNINYYWTLVGYYNSRRELGGGGALYREDIVERLNQIDSNRILSNEPYELSSRIPSTKIPNILSEIELDGDNGNEKPTIDAILSTSMFGTGVDVNHLSLMIVNGQPKTTSSYIQATGRIGRSHGGLVVTFLKAGRPRDLDHYETFPAYHHRLHLGIEPVSVSPFSNGALQKALGPVIISYLRNANELNNEWIDNDEGLFIHNSIAQKDILSFKQYLIRRLKVSKFSPHEIENIITYFDSQISHWQNVKLDDGKKLYFNEKFYADWNKPKKNVVLGDVKHTIHNNNPSLDKDEELKIVFNNSPKSLRDIDETIKFWVEK